MPEPFLQAEQLATGHCRHFFIFKPGHALKGLLAFSVFTAEMGPLKNAYVPSLGVAVCTQVGVSPGQGGSSREKREKREEVCNSDKNENRLAG